MNGKTSWISTRNNYALWYDAPAKDWLIGSVDNLGTSTGSIASNGNQGISSCPYNVPNDAWKYGEYTIGWIIADANDISVECLTGNDYFWSLITLWETENERQKTEQVTIPLPKAAGSCFEAKKIKKISRPVHVIFKSDKLDYFRSPS